MAASWQVAAGGTDQSAENGWGAASDTSHMGGDFNGGHPYRDEYYDDQAARPRTNLGVVIAIGVAVVAAVVIGVSLVTLGGGSGTPAAAPVAGTTEIVTPTSPVSMSAVEASTPSEADSSTSSSPSPSVAQAAPITGVGSNRCIDIPGANNADGTQLDIFTCNGTAAQAWTYSGGTVQAMGKCLDVRGASRHDKTPVQVFTCNGTDAQRWTYDARTGELKTLGKCLDASGAATGDNTPLILYTCNKGTNQQWRLAH
ncbi:ricin-type beta-trefoil lectin domain protein [Catenulispora yoronensis]